jgi:hypothetical protein
LGIMRARNQFSGTCLFFGLIGLLAAWQGAGCERGPLELVCTPQAEGALVITEVSEADWRWIEIANPGAAEVELTGMRVQFMSLDGSGVAGFSLREEDLTLAAGGRFVMARFPAAQRPAWADFAYGDEQDADFPPGGILELLGCGQPDAPIDRITWSDLPTGGSWAFDGGQTPSALANDSQASWCQDSHSQTLGAGPYDTVLGSPGEGNPPCATP